MFGCELNPFVAWFRYCTHIC